MAEKEVRKTTAKKAVRRTTSKVAPRKTPTRRIAETPPVQRKAPSRSTNALPVRKRGKKMLVGVAALVVVIGASIAIGFSDKGHIDVSSVIATRKQNATPEEQQTFQTIPVQQTQTTVANGGLVSSQDQTPVLVPSTPPEAESTATTTQTGATSTDDSATEDTEATEPQAAETAPQEDPIVQ